MSDIQLSCKCLGRNFTPDEWHEYLYQHPDAHSEPVFQFEGYEYNVYDICLNPHIPVKIELGGCKVSIMTARLKFAIQEARIRMSFWNLRRCLVSIIAQSTRTRRLTHEELFNT